MKKIVIGGVVLLMVMASPLVVVVLLFMAMSGSPAQAQDNPCVTPLGPLSSGPVRAPLVGSYTATSPYGMRVNPGGVLKGRLMLHGGIDLVSPKRTIVAAMAGRVRATPVNAIGGYHVYVDVGGGVEMYYAHMVAGSVLVKPGDPVWAGRPLGTEGATGNVTGVHLHFEIRVNGKPVDPVPWMASKGAPLPAIGTSSTGGAAASAAPAGSSGSTSSAAASSSSSSSPVITTFDGSFMSSSAGGASGTPSSTGSGSFALPPPIDKDRKASRTNPPLSIPVDVKNAYLSAAKRFGIPWTLLAGIGMEETGHGRNTNESSAGARGPMQWLPKYWGAYAIDGNNDGTKDILNIWDAAATSANVLVQNGAKKGPEGVRKAIWMYNHANWYVADVLYYAQRYGGGDIGTDPGSGCDGQAPAPGKAPEKPAPGHGSGARVVEAARAYIGTPYSWGGGDVSGPTRGKKWEGLDGSGTVGFDCSGLVIFAVYRGFGATLPHSSEAQSVWGGDSNVTATPVPRDFAKMKPGDLIAFSKRGGETGTFGHIGIYIGDHKMIDAPKPGTPVRIFDLDTKGAYDKQTWRVLRLSNKADSAN